MPEEREQERTEPATPKRRKEARKKGQVAQSKEIPCTLILFSALGFFFFSGSYCVWNIARFMTCFLQDIGTKSELQFSSIYSVMVNTGLQVSKMVIPFMVAVSAAGLIGNVLQIGFFATGEPLSPKLYRLNPLKGMERLLSLRSLAEVVKAVLKIFLIGIITFLTLKNKILSMPDLTQMNVKGILSFWGSVSFRLTLNVCLFLTALAAADYIFQRWQYEKNLRMTKQEVKDELKQREGDPLIKARIRKVQMEMARRRMMEAVKDSDVVITNPTRLAVALKYDPQDMVAPKVVAKGAGFVAEKIREVARKNGVAIVENKALAQAIYKAVEIGSHIPVNLYQAVAEVLAYVYRLKGERKWKQ